MDLDSLRCFVEAADTLQFRSAARRVALSPGAFSDRIKRLEEELGAPLFDRTTRRTRLTVAGQRLVEHARAVIALAAACRSVVHAEQAPPPFALTIGTRFELGLSWLCPAIQPLRDRRPERTVHLYMGDAPDLGARLGRGDLDAVVFSARLTSARLSYAALHPETYVFVARAPVLAGPDDAAACTLVDVSPDLPLFRYLLDALPDASPWPFARHEYMGGIGAIRYRVLEGAGCAVLPEYFVRDDLDAGRLVRLLPEVALQRDTFRLVWRQDHPREAELLALADELRARPLT